MRKICFFIHHPEMGQNALFERGAENGGGPSAMADFRRRMTEVGYTCDTDDVCPPEQADIFMFHRLDLVCGKLAKALSRNPRAILALLAFEEPVICGLHEEDLLPRLDLDAIFTWRDDLLDGGRMIKVNIPQPLGKDPGSSFVPFSDRKLVVSIEGFKSSRHPREQYSLRREVLRGLVNAGVEVDLFGRGWSNCEEKSLRDIWRGEVDDKAAVQRNYRFSLCIQNARDYPGDVCEKIFDAMKTGSVPIYRGASNIEDHVSKDCYLDLRDFDSVAALAAKLESMDENEYRQMQEAGQAFLRSDLPARFSGVALADAVAPVLEALSGRQRKSRSGLAWLVTLFLSVVRSLWSAPRETKLLSLKLMVRSALQALR